MTWTPGLNPEVILSNLKPGLGTVDLFFNPLTWRLEVCRSDRIARDVFLSSMDPADWQTGQWKQECRLLNCSGNGWPADGFHPAAAVIDRKRGVQHIFIYSGHVDGPSGVFRPHSSHNHEHQGHDALQDRVAPKSLKNNSTPCGQDAVREIQD